MYIYSYIRGCRYTLWMMTFRKKTCPSLELIKICMLPQRFQKMGR